jgi:hypothetical protein
MTFSLSSTGLPTDGMWKCDPLFADFNGDGLLDLAAIPRLGNGARVWFGNGRGEWLESSSGLERAESSCGGGLDAGDINRDGHLDLAVADHCRGVFVFLGDGTGQWQATTEELNPSTLEDPTTPVPANAGAEDLALGDVNGDGFLDIVASSSDQGGINVYLGDGTGRNWKRSSAGLPQGGWATRVILADVNQDGAPDIIASLGDGPRVYLNGRGADWQPASEGLPTPLIGGIYGGLAAGDLNEDGWTDFAVANWVDGPEVYLRQADGSWKKNPDVFPAMVGGATGLALGDINRDGHLDIIVSGRLKDTRGCTRGVFALRGDGVGGWKYVAGSGLPETGLAATPGLALGDVNGDGAPDVAASSGLIVETGADGFTQPTIPFRLLVWRTQLPAAPGSPGGKRAPAP